MNNFYLNTKQFWITTIKKRKTDCGFRDHNLSISDWERKINEAATHEEMNTLGRKLCKEMIDNSKIRQFFGVKELDPNEEKKLSECIVDDIADDFLELKKRYDVSKNDVKTFEDKLKAIIGDDLTNWETKIVKAGSSDKDIVDLQKKISELAAEKDNLQTEIKKKQDQILNHKCDTPNNAELNQDKLQSELNKKNFNPSLSTPPSNDGEDKKEKLENDKLTLEKLRKKLKTKQEEIKSLFTRLNQQKVQVKHHDSYSLGTLFATGIISLLFGSLIMFIIKKKKKKTTTKSRIVSPIMNTK